MSILQQLKEALKKAALNSSSDPARFFKTAPGQYAAHDQFIGVPVPKLRTIAKQFQQVPLHELEVLIASPINEERLIALLIVVLQYQRGTIEHKEACYQWYMRNLRQVNNWNLVDSSAHLILGAHTYGKNYDVLFALSRSCNLWERRIAIVATWYFIKQKQVAVTFALAELLLNDTHDLMHKAVGWMLREAGKKDQQALHSFLSKHALYMPRTMLRYAIEKFTSEERQKYLLMRENK